MSGFARKRSSADSQESPLIGVMLGESRPNLLMQLGVLGRERERAEREPFDLARVVGTEIGGELNRHFADRSRLDGMAREHLAEAANLAFECLVRINFVDETD